MPMYTLWLRTSRKVNWNHAGSTPAMGAKLLNYYNFYVIIFIMFKNWDNPEAIQEIINKSTGKGNTLVNMGYSNNNSTQKKKLNIAIEQFDLDITSFKYKNLGRWIKLEEVVGCCHSYAEVLRKVGLADRGGNYFTLKNKIDLLGIDISHFIGNGKGTTRGAIPSNKIPLKEIFCENSLVRNSVLRNRVINNNLLEYKCTECGLYEEWQGKKLTLELDHINGDRHDNRIKNLRFLCPNCHSQTPTYKAKNIKQT